MLDNPGNAISLEEAEAKLNRAREWGEPDLSILNTRMAPAIPELKCFRNWAGWIDAAAQSRSVPVEYILGPLLAVSGSILSNTRLVKAWSGWVEPPIIWSVLVGDPAAGKTPALDACIGPVRKLEDELSDGFPIKQGEYERDRVAASEHRENWQAEVKDAVKQGFPPPDMPDSARELDKPNLPRLAITDATIEALIKRLAENPRGLLCIRDEISGLVKGFDRYSGGGDKSFWLEAYEGRRYVVDRVGKGGEPIIVPRTSVGLLGGTQPDVAQEIFTQGNDDGFAARCLFVWPEAIPPQRPRSHENASQLLNALRRLRGLGLDEQEGHEIPRTVLLSERAADLFQTVRTQNFHAIQSASGLMKSFLGKTPGKIIRIALILEYLEWSLSPEGTPEPEEISVESLAAAADLVGEYFNPMAARLFGDAGLPKLDRTTATLARAIYRRRSKAINLREIRREWKLPGLREASDVAAAAEVLTDSGWFKYEPHRKGGTPGQQSLNYLVNPNVWNDGNG